MKKYVIAMDQGTTSSRCILFDRQGNICSVAQKEFPQLYPQPGWVEHDPMEIWSTQMGVTMEAMQKVDARADEIAAIGITNQRETTVVWDGATGEPVYNAIVWQCRRTADRIDRLRQDGWWEAIRQRTGLIPDAYFSASKIAWLLDHVPGARARAERGELKFGTVDSWLIWNLTEGRVHATDRTNASRTMLYDIHKLCWDQEILDYFRIPASMLPQVYPSSHIYGTTGRFGGSIPIAAAAGDQQAALFGQCGFEPGDVKSTYGTGGFLLMNTGGQAVQSTKGLLTTIAASAGQPVSYALEGSVFVGGAVIQWLRDELHLITEAADSEYFARKVSGSGGVYVVPAFTGLGAPHWDMYARGAILGLTRGTGRDHIIRAALESIAYQTGDVLSAMEEDTGIPVRELRVDGGASANDFLMEFQADIAGRSILRPVIRETTALGAAYLAGLAAGVWRSREEIRGQWTLDRRFDPGISPPERQRLLAGWHKAVERAKGWET